ncbi:dienelactone hydrolase family protein [Arenibacter sp. 6A1]|uniref:dienelactone hydrolase family protein n=1 Tax=Arenibacter sp. 6A1 TaxID=2720391 RepID=UPI0014485E1E|nr:dienelactone hydrolase family protein [Arenibacter sp. 6A1]NKI27595.1 dienelactone hydrolase family protein [Arenibacter sp. 6A1]
MKKITKEDIKQEVFDLYDDYAHNRVNRRLFLDKLGTYAVGGLTVGSLLSFLSPDYVKKIQIGQNDARLKSDYITYDSPKGGGQIKALLSRPAGTAEKLPGIVVVHENRGLNPHIEDVARRAALAGFISLAPDALTPLGGYPGNDDAGRELQQQRNRDEMLQDFIAGFEFLKNHSECTGKVGVVGFCFGGWISNMMAVKIPDLAAAVPFYGGQPTEGIDQIKAPLLLQFAELDQRVNEGWPAYETSLKQHQIEYTAYMYPKVHHGFHNDTTPRYDREAAELAWERTLAFFREKLK